jgi:hypothetical protein
MSNRNLQIAFISLIGVGILVAMVISGVFSGKNNTNTTSFDQALKTTTDNTFGNENIPNTAREIIQNGLIQNDLTNSGSNIDDTLNTFDSIDDPKLLEKYKVDTLLDGTIVYSLTREDIQLLNINSYYGLGYDEKTCLSTCSLVKTKDAYLALDYDIYYLSSFEKEGKVLWIGFVKNTENYVYAKIAEANFLNAKTVYFTGGTVTKINQKGANSSEYSFDIKDGDPVSVNFRDKVIEDEVNPIETQIFDNLQDQGDGFTFQGEE